jgi:cytosine/adenosine deaminase-related metal-dependent hydrolase
MLENMGVWDHSITGSGKHPIDHLAEALSCAAVIAAHVNYAEEHHLDLLAKWGTTVAYCPRASEYFGHPQNGAADHRYRDMLARGINVALGTDSLVCLQTPERLSVLDDMRRLYSRDHTDPATLIRMGTINGASALGFDAQLVQLASGRTAGIIALPFDVSLDRDPVEQVLLNDAAPRWIVGPAPAENSWHVG